MYYVAADDADSQCRTLLDNQGCSTAMLDGEDNRGDVANPTDHVVEAIKTSDVTSLGYYPK